MFPSARHQSCQTRTCREEFPRTSAAARPGIPVEEGQGGRAAGWPGSDRRSCTAWRGTNAAQMQRQTSALLQRTHGHKRERGTRPSAPPTPRHDSLPAPRLPSPRRPLGLILCLKLKTQQEGASAVLSRWQVNKPAPVSAAAFSTVNARFVIFNTLLGGPFLALFSSHKRFHEHANTHRSCRIYQLSSAG